MNIVNTLTLRHIKTHKKRSILTVVAIIVSVAMVTAVFTSSISFIKFFQNATIALDGNWHAKFTDKDYSLHKPFYATDENIVEFGARASLGHTDFGIENSSHISFIFAAEKNWFSMRNVTVSQGRLPVNSHELLLTTTAIEEFELNVNVGDKITIPVTVYNAEKDENEEIKREYTVVGISDSFVSATENYEIFSGLDSEALEMSQETLVLARYDKLNNSIWDKMKQTEKSVGLDSYGYHSDLFNYSGIMANNGILVSLGLFAGILLFIIAVVSIFMIYDSFAVSYQERAKYLGMLASVGATKRQKRKSIYFEGLILGAISIPLGIISGIGGIAVTFKCIEDAFLATMNYPLGTLKVYVNWIVIVGTVLASALTIFISMWIPARKASKTTAIDAIRQVGTVKVKKPRKLRTSKLTEKLFGYEGVLAVKNFKRNGRRSKNIVFALSLSVIVFLTVTNFSMMLSDTMRGTFVSTPDVYINGEYEDKDIFYEAVESNKNIDRYFIEFNEFISLSESCFKNSENADLGMALIFLDNESFDEYIRQLGERTEKYHDKNNPTAIVFNSAMKQSDNKKKKEEPLKNLEGQQISFKLTEYSGYDENTGEPILTEKDGSVTVGVQTTKEWKEEKFNMTLSPYPMAILSVDHIDSLYNGLTEMPIMEIYIMCDDYSAVSKEIEKEIEKNHTTGGYYIGTPKATAQSMNNLFTIVKVFVYGFITLISIISVLNIINTISNSMNERRREFAMIRSVGMTPKSFKRMIYLEAVRYGAKALVFSFPVGVLIHFAMYKALASSMDFGFNVHILPYFAAAGAVFVIIAAALIYSIDKIRDDNIIETLKTDIN